MPVSAGARGFFDARKVPKGATISTDICIVGAGAAGITLARELIGQRFDVCLLESGGLELDMETQTLHGGTSVGHAYLPLEATRLRFFGGTTYHWGGASRPLDALDFQARAWVPFSGWPLTREELVPYYERAHPVLQLGPFVYDAKSWTASDRKPAALVGDVLRNGVLQQSPPTRFGEVYRDEIKAATNVRTYLHANALEIETLPTGKAVTRLRVASLARNDFFVAARLYVLATGGIENARLLLLSDRTNPRGVGNHNDLVGRFFMDHPNFHWAKSATLLPLKFPLRFYQERLPATLPDRPDLPTRIWGFISPAEETQRRHALLNFGIAVRRPPEKLPDGIESLRVVRHAFAHGELPDELWTHVANVVGDFDEVAVHGYRKLMGEERPVDQADVAYWTEPQPNPDSRVYLSRDLDAFGQRRIVLDWRLTEQDRYTMRTALTLFAQEVGKAGIGRVRIVPTALGDAPDSLLRPSYHHMGTTRMHADPKRGVVDANCRMHEVANLYVAGSSVFPAAGHANPTITIVALAIRLADHLKQVMQRAPVMAEVKK